MLMPKLLSFVGLKGPCISLRFLNLMEGHGMFPLIDDNCCEMKKSLLVFKRINRRGAFAFLQPHGIFCGLLKKLFVMRSKRYM